VGFSYRVSRLALFLTAFSDAKLHAQQNDLASILARLGEQAEKIERSLPSFACQQSATSEELRPEKHGAPKVLRHAEFTANLRVVRGGDGALVESAEFLTVDRQPFTSQGFVMPAYSQGGFRQAMSYFLPAQQPCYRYMLTPGRLEFEGAPGSAERDGCRSAGTRGFVLLDSEGNITHLERRVSVQGVTLYHLVPSASLELVPVTLNGETYRLSSHLVSERQNGPFLDRFETSYTNCRLFAATVTIGPAGETPSEKRPQP
jgi:hypothetical protein